MVVQMILIPRYMRPVDKNKVAYRMSPNSNSLLNYDSIFVPV